jgi:predicted transcriptional regulator
MSKRRVTIHIGDMDDMGRRFVAAWKAAERGKAVQRDHVTFLSLEAFMSTMSPKRLDLLRRLRGEGPMSVRKLAASLERDYKSVHRDVALLADTGLVERQAEDRVAVTWDRAVTQLDLAA